MLSIPTYLDNRTSSSPSNGSIANHPDGRVALSPAYDILAYSVYLNGRGHALRFAPDQKKRLLDFMMSRPMMQSLIKRRK